MRQKAVDTLRSSVWIGTGLQDEQTAEYTLGKYPQQLCLYKQNPTGGASHLMASAIASPKTWAGTWSIKALAIALHRNFVLTVEVPRHGPQSSTHREEDTRDMALSLLPTGKKHTRKGNNRVDLPSEALDAATCFIVYDGQAHFWAALRDAEPPTLEQMLAAGMVMEAPFSTV
ncbi:TPA: hypothetical protein ACH3X1_003601 [Trebouxia sp. C0004]